MSLFQQMEGDACILVNRGIYRQCDLFQRDGYVFAKWGAGYVRLKADGSTSKDKLRLEHIESMSDLAQGRHSSLCLPNAEGAKALDSLSSRKLLGHAA